MQGCCEHFPCPQGIAGAIAKPESGASVLHSKPTVTTPVSKLRTAYGLIVRHFKRPERAATEFKIVFVVGYMYFAIK